MTDLTGTSDRLDDGPSETGRPQRRDEHLLWLALLVSTTGDWIYRFALPLLVLRLTGSALSTAFTYVLEFVPYVVLGLFIGGVADRVDCRRLMIACDSSAAVVVGLIAALFTLDHPPVPALYATALLLGCLRPFYFPAFQSFLVDRVPAQRRPLVNAWVQGTDSTLNMLGPVAGLSVVVLIGPAVASAVNAVSFAVSALCIALTTSGGRRPSGSLRGVMRNVRTDFLAGLQVLGTVPALFWGTALMTLTNCAALAVEANLVYVLAGPGGTAPASLGIVFALHGAGALLGASVAPALIRRFPVGRLLTMGMAVFAVALALPAVSTRPVVIAASWGLVGVATSTIIVPWFTFRQGIVPSDMIGRVTSVGRALSYVTIPIGAVVGSWVVTGLGTPYLFLLAGAVQAAVWAGTVWSPLGRVDLRRERTELATDS
jgi:predicted MFS family arabinose efflux permease